jgi:hypothetical protein
MAILREKIEKYKERKKKKLIIAVWFPLTKKSHYGSSIYTV